MKSKLPILLGCLLAAVVFLTAAGPADVSVSGNAVGEVKSLIDGIIGYGESAAGADSAQEWLDGGLARNAGSTSEWYVLALRQYENGLDYSAYADSLEKYLSENTITGAASRQRYALILSAVGRGEDSFVSSAADDSIGKQGVMSWIFGLHLLNNGITSAGVRAESAVEKLLSLRLSDGGWALTGEYSDVDVTAMAVQALSPYRDTDAGVRSATDGAIKFLAGKQLADGCYQSYGTANPESAAQVITALTSAGTDPEKDPRFVKNGHTLLDGLLKYRLADGSFSHTEGGASDNTATVQALYSLVSLWRLRSGLGPLYIFENGASAASQSRQSGAESGSSGSTAPVSGSSAPASGNAASTSGNAASTSGNAASTSGNAASTSGNSAPDSGSQTSETVSSAQKSGGKSGYKLWVCLGIGAAAAAACAVLAARGKKGRLKNCIFVLLAAALALCAVLLTNFSSKSDYYREAASKTGAIGKVTITIRCDTIVGKSDSPHIPKDGVILPVTEFEIADGDTVFDILTEAAKKYDIQVENEGSALSAHGLTYISGINYLYEFDFGDLSGWVYRVNGTAPSVGCGDYRLADGDAIEWLYTCDLGNDLG